MRPAPSANRQHIAHVCSNLLVYAFSSSLFMEEWTKGIKKIIIDGLARVLIPSCSHSCVYHFVHFHSFSSPHIPYFFQQQLGVIYGYSIYHPLPYIRTIHCPFGALKTDNDEKRGEQKTGNVIKRIENNNVKNVRNCPLPMKEERKKREGNQLGVRCGVLCVLVIQSQSWFNFSSFYFWIKLVCLILAFFVIFCLFGFVLLYLICI